MVTTPPKPKPIIAACSFGDPDKTYDYLSDFAVQPGDKVVIETRRGEQTVTVIELKTHSEKATAYLLRPAPKEELL